MMLGRCLQSEACVMCCSDVATTHLGVLYENHAVVLCRRAVIFCSTAAAAHGPSMCANAVSDVRVCVCACAYSLPGDTAVKRGIYGTGTLKLLDILEVHERVPSGQ